MLSIDALESEALSVIAAAGFVAQRRRGIGGIVVDIGVTGVRRGGDTLTVGLSLRNWPPHATAADAALATREASAFAAANPGAVLRMLVSGDVADEPLLTIAGLRELLAQLSPLVVTRSVSRGEPKSQPVFCAMPFHESFLDVYLLAIVPTMNELGFEVLRLDQTHSFSGISQRIWDGIADSRFVIADISGHNPNVLYELGVAHGLGVNTFLIVDSGTPIPFDIKDNMALAYDRQVISRLVKDLPTRIRQALG